MSVADPSDIVVEAPPPPHTPSPLCVRLLHHMEDCRLEAYMPTSRDRPTIGWGQTTWKGKSVRMGMKVTQEEADAEFLDELDKRAAQVRYLIKGTPTSQPQFDALVSFAYNVGVAALEESTLLRHHRAGHHEAAHANFFLWIYQKGKRLRGLEVRRAMEAQLYITPEGRNPPWLLADGTIKRPRLV